MAPEARGLLREAPAAILEATDAALGEVLEALPEDADVIVCSALGMGPDTSRADLLPGMLAAVVDGRTGTARWRRRPTARAISSGGCATGSARECGAASLPPSRTARRLR